MKSILRDLKTIFISPYVIVISTCLFLLLLVFLVITGIIIIKNDVPLLEGYHILFVEFLTKPLVGCLQVAAILLGLRRAFIFHPLFDGSYRRWLANTPWTPSHPLPKGPWFPNAADFVVLSFLSVSSLLLTWWFEPPLSLWHVTFGPFLFFATSLALIWTLANLATNQVNIAYFTISIPPLLSLIGMPPAYLFFSSIIMLLTAGRGVYASLIDFPWNEKFFEKYFNKYSLSSLQMVDWPYRDLLLTPKDVITTRLRAFIEALISGGWVWLFLKLVQESSPSEDISSSFMLIVGIGTLLASALRLIHYGPAICNRLCWGQRLVNKRWIIPAHDIIFLAPALIALIGTTLPATLYFWLEISLPIACGLPVAIVVFLARGVGPSVEKLHLTGVHSKFGTLNSANKEFTTASSKNS